MKNEIRKVGRPKRVPGSKLNKLIAIKLTIEEYKKVVKLAGEFDGNLNRLFRAKILGEK